ncbi:hypothetical protein R3P38DRAFT_2958582 [Favolaschia claudopus]|uniref:F-box domain-containing protein n=1 Tax=Favolaschia claudopus TaxID=2862362 RepID=A0AAW0BAZ0_9AGAR
MEFFEVQSPSIRDRLRYNQLPSDSERLAIQVSIHSAQARLIEPPSSTVEAAEIKTYIAQYSSLLAPIRRLPVDILRAIFLQPLAHERSDRKFAQRSIILQYKPNTLGGVCFHWRCVTCETAPLWSHLIVVLNRPSRSTIDGLRIALRRSRNVPLDLDFRSVRLSGMLWSTEDSDMMQEVLIHSERWAHISLILDSRLLQQLSPAQNRLQNLHALTLSGDTVDDLLPTLVFSNAPKLRLLKVTRMNRYNRTELPPLPWHQLTEVCVDNNHDNPELLHHVLSRGEDVHELSLRLFSDSPPLPHIVSSSVQKIVMYGHLGINKHEMEGLNHMTIPGLTDLRLVHCRFWNLPVIQAFAQRSSFNLQTLMLHSVPIRARELSLLLGLVQTVEILHLQDLLPNAITNEVMDALNTNISPTPLLPGLTALTVSGTYLSDFGKVLALLESRLTSSNHIPRVAVLDITLFNVGFSAQSLQRLHSFRVMQGFRFLSVDDARRSMTMQFGFAPRIRWVQELDLQD